LVELRPILPLKEAKNVILTHGNGHTFELGRYLSKNENDENIYFRATTLFWTKENQEKEIKEDWILRVLWRKNYKKSRTTLSIWFYDTLLPSIQIQVKSKFAFVSTIFICQAHKLEMLWPKILSYELEIFFAFKDIKWTKCQKVMQVCTV